MADHLGARAHAYARYIVDRESMLLAKCAHRFHSAMCGYVAWVALDAQSVCLPSLAQPCCEQRNIGFRTIRVEKPEASIENRVGAFEARPREPCRQDSRLGGASQVQSLDHRAVVRLCEGEEPAAERADDAKRLA